MNVPIKTLENKFQSIYWKDAAYCNTCGYIEGTLINDFIKPLRHSGCTEDCQESWDSEYITNCVQTGQISIEEQNYCDIVIKYHECAIRFQMGVKEEIKRKQDEKKATLKKQQDMEKHQQECAQSFKMAAEEEVKRKQDEKEARLKKQQDIDEKYRECIERFQMAAEEEAKRHQDQVDQVNYEADMRIQEEEREEIKRSHHMYGLTDDSDFDREYYIGCDEI